jgi:class 3 adenylate cyclase
MVIGTSPRLQEYSGWDVVQPASGYGPWGLADLVSGRINVDAFQRQNDWDQEILNLRQQLAQLVEKSKRDEATIQSTVADQKRQAELVEELKRDKATIESTVATLESRLKLGYLLNSVELKAQEKLESIAGLFSRAHCCAFVMSVDIRKSTDLMLKATDPKLFASFIQRLCGRLKDTVLAHHGVFDKFTGDGILAFFPDFSSGDDAGYLAVQTAAACHSAFKEEYRQHRDCFSCVRNDAGLGIGIDFGRVALVADWGSLTIVGTPVVYACRYGSAPGGMTLLNQQAYSEIHAKYSAFCTIDETTIEIKNEGHFVGYSVRPNGKPYEPKPPKWLAGDEAAPSSASTLNLSV